MTHPSVNLSEEDKKYKSERRKEGDISLHEEERISSEQRARLETLLPAAQRVIQSVEDKLVALSIAATVRWTPEKSPYETDENSAPVFGDAEYEEFLSMAEEIAENAFFQEISKFFGIPDPVVNEVLVESFKSRFTPTTKKAGPTYVSYKAQSK